MSKKSLLAAPLLATLCLAACSPDPTPAGNTADADRATVDATTAGAAPAQAVDCPAPVYSATPPEVVEVDVPFYVRTDRAYETKAGEERRRTTIELMEGDPAAIAREIVDGYVARRFRQLEVADKGDGTTRYAVTKAGVGRVNVTATNDRGANPSHPRSVGLLSFDWPLEVSNDETVEDPGA